MNNSLRSRPIGRTALVGGAVAAMTIGLAFACLARSAGDERAPAAVPEPIASPSPGVVPALPAAQFADGTAYSPAVTVNLVDGRMQPGTSSATVGVELSGPSANTVIAFVRCVAGVGAGPVRDRTQAIVFRPGDPLRATASCEVRAAGEGTTIRFAQAKVPDGAKRGRAEAVVTVASAGPATPTVAAGLRAPYRFTPLGTISYSSDGKSLSFDDAGGPNVWSSSLFHGRVQPSNLETGYYGTVAMGAIVRTGEGVALRTRKLPMPVGANELGGPYPFLAGVLSGHKTPEVHFHYGSVEWDVKMPDRSGSWPALWLLPGRGWPPEIDVYEGFGYNPEWDLPSGLSTNLHGGHNKRTFTRAAHSMQMSDFGLPNTLTSAFHKFQVTVDPGWITIFVDGVETMRYANPFAGTNWYPVMSVAVRTDRNSAYADGSGDMVIRSVKVWRAQ